MSEIPYNLIDLTKWSQRFGPEVEQISKVVLENPKFATWWGGLKGQHHDFSGGLAKHTTEVVELCFNSVETLGLTTKINKKELFLSALFHDAGKMYDYQPRDIGDCYGPDMVAAPHKRTIHHITRSAIIWSHAVSEYPEFSDKYHDSVLHNILSHHGHREWGSPVAPKTQVAWLLHLCDGISARMNDCDRLDLVHGKPKDAK
jgi:3'-5' exoribonuclease